MSLDTSLPPIPTPLKPGSKSFDNQTFHTLTREAAFLHPPSNQSDIPALDELVAPHIDSFNALMEDGENGSKGLLALAVEDIGAKVVFDGKKPGEGNRLSSEYMLPMLISRKPEERVLVVSPVAARSGTCGGNSPHRASTISSKLAWVMARASLRSQLQPPTALVSDASQ